MEEADPEADLELVVGLDESSTDDEVVCKSTLAGVGVTFSLFLPFNSGDASSPLLDLFLGVKTASSPKLSMAEMKISLSSPDRSAS